LKRILHLYKEYYPVSGGIQQAIKSVIKLTPEYSHTVLVTSAVQDGMQDVKGSKVIYCKASFKFLSMPISLKYIIKAAKLAKQSDIVCIHYPFPMSELAVLLSGCKNIVYFWHSDIVSQKKTKYLIYPIIKTCLKKSCKIFISYPDMAVNSDILHSFQNKTVLCPYVVDEIEGQIEKSYNSEKYILSVGRLVPYKGFEYIIKAMQYVKGLKLIICGSGPLSISLEELITELGLQNQVSIKGNLSDEEIATLYSECEFFVFPSCMKSEAFGIAMLEAMSFGKAIINTKLDTGVNWVARDGYEALTVPPSNSEALTESIKCLYFDIELRRKMGNNSKLRAKKIFAKSKRREILLKHFSELI